MAAGGEPRRLLQAGQIAGQRHLRRAGRDRSDGIADDQAALDEVDVAHHRVGRIEHLGEPGARPAAQRRQRRRQAGAGDEVVGRRTEADGAQQPGDLDEEAGDTVRPGMFEHVAVPAWALDHRPRSPT